MVHCFDVVLLYSKDCEDHLFLVILKDSHSQMNSGETSLVGEWNWQCLSNFPGGGGSWYLNAGVPC